MPQKEEQAPHADKPSHSTSPAISQKEASDPIPAYQTKAFRTYWYANQAELAAYTLQQSRYGEVHEGEAVLIFVTEPFSASKQVKLDNVYEAGEDKVNVLKLNYTKKFLTGIYPYTLMSSVFTPVQVQDQPHTLKVSTTSQEWCGHTFLQLNRQEADYHVAGFSYFESEGDMATSVEADLLEDELWTRLRLQPESIPTGSVNILPSSMYIRLLHRPIQAQAAYISRGDTTIDGKAQAYLRVYYPGDSRNLLIYHDAEFPYAIYGWDETYNAPAWAGNPSSLKTTARRTGLLKSPYWQQHLNRHRELRRKLGLSKHSMGG